MRAIMATNEWDLELMDVAETARVLLGPVSWVYGRTRRRGKERITREFPSRLRRVGRIIREIQGVSRRVGRITQEFSSRLFRVCRMSALIDESEMACTRRCAFGV